MLKRQSRAKSKRDLRPVHAPGSVSSQEARNLYFEEEYTEEALVKSSSRLLSSIGIGNNIAVGFTDQLLQKKLRRHISGFGLHISGNDLKELRILNRIEDDKPYLCFLKFLLWLCDTVLTREYEEEYKDLKNLLKKTEGMIYFAPGKDREKYSTIPIPRLDVFITNWLEPEERSEALKKMRDNLYNFMKNLMENAKRRAIGGKVVQDRLNLIAKYYDMFSEQLIKSGFVSSEYLRRMIDVIIELSQKFDVSVNLSFMRNLISR